MGRGAAYVGQVFRHAGLQLVFAGAERRRRDHEPSRVHDRGGHGDVDAGLRAGASRADDLHARLPGQAVRGGRRDADFRPDAQLLPAHGFLRHVPRETQFRTRGVRPGGR